jgi:hypothetical protein
MLGGLFTSFLMELLIYPIIFYVAKGFGLTSSTHAVPQGALAVAGVTGNEEIGDA